LVVRAAMRWVIVGVWCKRLAMVGGGFSIWGSCASCGIVCCIVYWGWLVGGGVDVVVSLVCRHMSRCGVCSCRYSLGVRLRGELLVKKRFVSVVLKGELGCGLLVIFGACVFLGLSLFCCVTGDALSPVVPLSSVGFFGRLRLVLCVFCVWWSGYFVVCLIC
jgi:hypothetical protein